MPVVAVIGAVVAIGVAAEVGTTLAVIAAVGATVGAVGAVTQNKALMIAGGVIGAVGIIGSIAQATNLINLGSVWEPGSISGMLGSAGSAGAAGASEAGMAAAGSQAGGIDAEIAQWSSYGSNIDQEIAQWSNYGADLGMNSSGAIGSTPDVGTNLGAAPNPMPDPTVGEVQRAFQDPVGAAKGYAAGIPQGGGEGGTLGTVGNPADPNVAGANQSILGGGPGGASTTTPPGTPTPDATGSGVTGMPEPSGINRLATGSGLPDGTTSAWGGIKDFVKDNGRLLAGVVQAGSSFLAGSNNGLTPAQIAALEAQADANRQATALSRWQMSNMQQQVPIARRVPATQDVTGQPQGIINRAPLAPPPPVTGAPAGAPPPQQPQAA